MSVCAECGMTAANPIHFQFGTAMPHPFATHWYVEEMPEEEKRQQRIARMLAARARKPRSIYVIGSMRNPRVPEAAKALRAIGWDAFDDWYSSGPETDDKWQEYERARGRTYREALDGAHARNVFEFDKKHLDRCSAAVLVAKAGASAHLELGYMIGCGKPGYILLPEEPERYDIMVRLATSIFMTVDEMCFALSADTEWQQEQEEANR